MGVNRKIKIRVNGRVIERVPKFHSVGNFQIMTVRYYDSEYIVGDGDEYLRGFDKVFALGKKLTSKVVAR